MAVQNNAGSLGAANSQNYNHARHKNVQAIFERNLGRLKSANESISLAASYENLTARAMAYQRLGQFGLAADDYLAAFKLDSKMRQEDMKNAVLCLDWCGRLERAIDLAKGMFMLYGHDSSCGLFVGSLLYKKGQYSESLPYLQEAVKTMKLHGMYVSNPDLYVRALSYLAMSLYFSQDYGAAETALTELLKLRKDNKAAHMRRGHCYIIHGKFVPAIDDFMYASVLDPEDMEAVTKLGMALAYAGNLDIAYPYLVRALGKHGPHHAAALYNMGIYLYQTEKYSSSMEHLQKAVEENPFYAQMANQYIEKIKGIFRNEADED